MAHTATSHVVEYTGASVKFIDVENLNRPPNLIDIAGQEIKENEVHVALHNTGFCSK